MDPFTQYAMATAGQAIKDGNLNPEEMSPRKRTEPEFSSVVG